MMSDILLENIRSGLRRRRERQGVGAQTKSY